MIELNKIYQGDCLEVLKTFDDNCIDCCVTSPPYFGLRDYGTAKWEGGDIECNHDAAKTNPLTVGGFTGERLRKVNGSENEKYLKYKNSCSNCGAIRIDNQIGLEETPELYVNKLVKIFDEVKRVLSYEGILWLNLGDSYASNTKGSGGKNSFQPTNKGSFYEVRKFNHGVKEKDLIGIPWMVAFALRQSGWYLRQDIIWHKPNPMPESVTDRCTKSHEYIFLLTKCVRYYYDANAIKDPYTEPMNRWGGQKLKAPVNGFDNIEGDPYISAKRDRDMRPDPNGSNKRSVWTVNTYPYSEAHFATFPERLIVDMIKAGCPENGIVLDPFMGAGTTGLVARKLNRNYVGIELNPSYIKIAEKRIKTEIGLFI